MAITVRGGQVTALLGANGAGKSSIVLAVAGLIREMTGSVAHDGAALKPVNHSRTRHAGLATVQEGNRFFADISDVDNLKIAALPLPTRERADAVDDMLDLSSELRGMPDRLGEQLSGGQQQMLAFASALVAKPKFLVIDEMSLGLAPVLVQRLTPAVQAVAAAGVRVLPIEQFTQVALRLATSAAVLAQAEITLQAPAADLRENPEQSSRACRLSPDLTVLDTQPINFSVPMIEPDMDPIASGFSLMAGIVSTKSRGRVRLASQDPADGLLIDPAVFADDRDIDRAWIPRRSAPQRRSGSEVRKPPNHPAEVAHPGGASPPAGAVARSGAPAPTPITAGGSTMLGRLADPIRMLPKASLLGAFPAHSRHKRRWSVTGRHPIEAFRLAALAQRPWSELRAPVTKSAADQAKQNPHHVRS